MEGSIRLDVAEGAIGGREWQLAYLRHPPFTTWLIELARETGPLRYAAVYAISQTLVIGGILAAAALAATMARSQRRQDWRGIVLWTVLMSFASPAATYIPIQLNHNIGLTFSTGLVILTAWRAFERATIAAWTLFGLAVGFSLWTKYAIGLTILPLAIAFLAVRPWRAQLLSPGPWLAVALAVIVIAPHAWFVLTHGATTVTFATRTTAPGVLIELRFALEWLLNAALLMLPMALAALLVAGPRALWRRIAAAFAPSSAMRADLFRHAIALGPVLITALAAFAGVKPRLLWLTPMVPGFALWWSALALPAADRPALRRGGWLVGGIAVLLAASYVAVRLASPSLSAKPLYPDFDGPALARLAQDYWQAHETAPIRYIITRGEQKGRQAGGSIAFDLPSPHDAPIHVMEDDLRSSPWIDLADLRARGAMVVSALPLADGAKIEGLPVSHVAELPRPMVRGATNTAARVWLGSIEPEANFRSPE